MQTNNVNTVVSLLPSVLQQGGVNSGLLVQQLSRLLLSPVLPLWFVHFLERRQSNWWWN